MMRHFVSLGVGVQSSTMLLMAIHGEIEPKPQAAIFADTGWEPKAVYEWLKVLVEISEAAGIPVFNIQKGNMRYDVLSGGKEFVPMPVFAVDNNGIASKLRRQCTREYKIEPVAQQIRGLMGLERGQRVKEKVSVWQGISVDEIGRAKPSRYWWQEARFPLLEKRMTRNDCLVWMEKHGYPKPPKSACIGCPYHDSGYWRDLKNNSPEEFQDAVEFDRSIRQIESIDGTVYLHPSLKPLDEIDFRTDEDKGQFNLFGEFGEECEGMCGL